MKISDLRDAADTALSADAVAATALASAQNAKIQTAGNVDTTRAAFSHGLQVVGGTVVDTASSPPKVYVTTDGVSYTVTSVPDINSDVPADPTSP